MSQTATTASGKRGSRKRAGPDLALAQETPTPGPVPSPKFDLDAEASMLARQHGSDMTALFSQAFLDPGTDPIRTLQLLTTSTDSLTRLVAEIGESKSPSQQKMKNRRSVGTMSLEEMQREVRELRDEDDDEEEPAEVRARLSRIRELEARIRRMR